MMGWSVPKPSRAQVMAGKKECRSNPVYAVNVFRRVYHAQQPEEIETKRYAGSDGGRGFRFNETYSLNTLYQQFEEQGWRLTPEQTEAMMERMEPYVEQHIRLGMEETAKAEEDAKRKATKKRKAKPKGKTYTPPEGVKPRPKLSKEERDRMLAALDNLTF